MTEPEFFGWVGRWLADRGFKGTSGNYLGHLLNDGEFELDDLTPEALAAVAALVPDDSQLSLNFTPVARSDFKGAAAIIQRRWSDLMNFAATYHQRVEPR
jgi:hypothetical protein